MLAEPDLSNKSKLAQLERILGNEAVEVMVQGVEVAISMQDGEQYDEPVLEKCPVCKGAKQIAGATCLRCKGTGYVTSEGKQC